LVFIGNTNQIILDDFVNNEFFIGANSLIDVSLMNNSTIVSEDKEGKGDLVN